MSSAFGLVVVILAILAAIGLGVLVTTVLPVSYERAEQFVERTGVHLTVTNASYVVDAIARTRRWRAAAVLLTLAVSIAWNLVAGTATFSFVTGISLAAAVLLGTVVGELRNASVRADGPRSATLSRRDESQYVGSWARTAPALLAVLAVVLVVVDLLVVPGLAVGILLMGLLAVAAWAASRWVTRFVVERPRPASADASIVAADDGLRSRALHAIGATTLLVSGWSVMLLAAFPFLGPTGEQTNTPLAVLAWTLLVGIAIAAWSFGRTPFLVPGADQELAAATPVEPDGDAAR